MIFFCDLKKVEWLSYIKLDKNREEQIQSCFKCAIEFHYPKNILEFKDIIEEFKVRSRASKTTTDITNEYDSLTSFYGENKKRDRLIVTDETSGLAERSEKFTSFLTVARKFRYHCVCIFHIIRPEKAIWISVISQTNIFNIFPASVPFNSIK